MKKILTALVLLTSITTFAQEKTTAKTDDQKWQVRFRVIAAVPQSKMYDLSGSEVKATTSVVPEVDFSYYFTKNLAAELILGTTHHKVKLEDNGVSVELGKVWLLPPTLNLQYHFTGKSATPYIGAGINYTIFYGAKDEGASLSYKNSVGFSTQAGCDFKISNNWFLNVDIKKVFLKSDVTVAGEPPAVLTGVKINPFIFGIGIGTRF